MSGHSKWSTIKRKKASSDASRGKLFTKLANVITVAAKSGGDPDANPTLRAAVDKARENDVPKDNIERAIKRGTGELDDIVLEEFEYDAVGPEGSAIIIEGVTDNKNRTISELRTTLGKFGSKLADTGSQRWQFNRRGVIELNLSDIAIERDELEMLAIEAGAEDVLAIEEDGLQIITTTSDLKSVRDQLEEKKVKMSHFGLAYIAKNSLDISEDGQRGVSELVNNLNDRDDVLMVSTNLT